VAWGNGACSNAGLLFQTFLTTVASHGYVVIVSGPKDAPLPSFARGARPATAAPPPAPAAAGGPPPPMTKDADLITAIDWAIRENETKAAPTTIASTIEGRGDGPVLRWTAGHGGGGRPAGEDGDHLEQRRVPGRQRGRALDQRRHQGQLGEVPHPGGLHQRRPGRCGLCEPRSTTSSISTGCRCSSAG
jgi:hypothetical protein